MTDPTPSPPPASYPTVTPLLSYAEPRVAIGWLTDAFGFQERLRLDADDGSISHAELSVGSEGVVMLRPPGPEHVSPRRDGHVESSLYVRLPEPEDVDEIYGRATTLGARSITAPTDRHWGDRECALEDLEGYHWVFWARGRLRDVAG